MKTTKTTKVTTWIHSSVINNNQEKKGWQSMGKKNRDKFDQRYERTDFSGLLKTNNTNKNKEKQKTMKNFEKREKKQEPIVVPEMAQYICDILADQARDYRAFIESGTDDLDTKKDMERNLFYFGNYATDISMTESDDEHPDEDPTVVEQVTIYAVDRTIKFNRDTHSLIRAALVAFAMKDGVPAYYINCYMTKDLIASISVVPLTEKGPVFRNAARWSNRPDSNAE